MKKIILMMIFSLFLIGFVNATNTIMTANPSSVSLNPGEVSQIIISYSINNTDGLGGANGISLTGSPKYISYNGGSIYYASNTTTTGTFVISVTIPQNASGGDYTNTISMDNSNINIPIHVNQIQNLTTYPIIVFPTAKVVNIIQGQTKNQNIQVIVPSNYPRSIIIQSVSFNPDLDVVKFSDLDLGVLNPGQTLNIPIIIDARNVQTGTYNTQINILATDSFGQVQLSPVNLQVLVSLNVNPITNDTFVAKPTCSLSNIEMNLNNTYTFTCSNAIEQIEVSPQYNEYLEGIKAEFNSGIFVYTFKAVKYGSTKFIAIYNYKGSPIFSPFSQDIKISSSGASAVFGTTLELEFFQAGVKKDENSLSQGETIVVVLDNRTRSIVSSSSIMLDGVLVNNTINLQPNKIYNLRVSSPGFLDLVMNNLTVNKNALTIIMNPEKSIYSPGELITMNCKEVNCSFLVDDVVINQPYSFSAGGNYSLKAVKEGYVTSQRNVSVVSRVSYKAVDPVFEDWKVGKDVSLELDRESNWSVVRDGVSVALGYGSMVNFKIESAGNYLINADGGAVISKNIESKGFWGFMKGIRWYGWIIIGVIIFIIFLIINARGGDNSSGVGFELGSKE